MKRLEPKYNKILSLKVGQQYYMSGTKCSVNSVLDYAKKLINENVSFTTEAREGGRLITRIK